MFWMEPKYNLDWVHQLIGFDVNAIHIFDMKYPLIDLITNLKIPFRKLLCHV